jgi:hypothetical protein
MYVLCMYVCMYVCVYVCMYTDISDNDKWLLLYETNKQ